MSSPSWARRGFPYSRTGGEISLGRLAGIVVALLALAVLALPSFASAAARLDINASHSPAGDLRNGQTATFTAELVNTGNAPTLPTSSSDPLSSLSALGISIEIPAGTTIVGYGSEDQSYWNGGLGNGCQFLDLLGTQQMICIAPPNTTLAPNETTPSVYVQLRVNGDASGVITPTWNGQLSPISGPPMYPTRPDPFTVIPSPAFELATTPQADLIKRGSTAELELELTNQGPLATDGSAVTITDELPAGMTLQSATSPGDYWSCAGTTTVSCTSNAVIAAGDTAPPLTLTASVAEATADTATNEATADGGGVVSPATSSTDLPVFGSGAEPVRLIVDPSAGATPDGDQGSFIRIHKAGDPVLLDFSKASDPVILNGGIEAGQVRIPQGSIELPTFTIPNFDLGIPLSIGLDMHIGMTATDDWGGTIDGAGNADLAMPMKFDYTMIPSLLPIDAFKCETGPVDLSNLTTGHQDPSNTLPPDPVTDGSPFVNGNGTVIDNGFTVGAAQPCSVNPLVGLVVQGVSSPIITGLINGAMGTPGTGSAPGNADAQIELRQANPADPILTLDKSVPAGSELYIDNTQTGAGTFRLAVSNSGGSATDGSDVTVTDQLPAGTTYVSSSSPDPNWSCAAAGQTVTCTLTGTTLNPGDTSSPVDIEVATDRHAWPTVVNQASVSGGGVIGQMNAVRHVNLVTHAPQLGLQVSGPDNGFTVGQPNASVDIQVSNLSSLATGGQPTAGQVYVSGQLPPGLEFDDSVNIAPWFCFPEEPDEEGQAVNCFFFASGGDAINPGGSRMLSLPVEVTQEVGDSVETSWSATGGGAPEITDPNDVSTTIDVVRPTLAVDMVAEGDLRNGGSGGSFVISLENTGTGGTTNNAVTITDILPAGLTPVNTSSEGGYWDCTTNGQRVTCDNDGVAIPAGESTPDLTIEVAVENPPVSVLTNVARVSGGASPDVSASVEVNTSAPVLSVTSTHTGDFTTGKDGQYRLLVTNDGDADTDGSEVTLTDTLPEGLVFKGASSAGDFWSCAAEGQQVNCTSSATIEAGSAAPVLRLTTAVGNAAVPGVTNVVRVSGGGSLPSSHADPTNVTRSRGARIGNVAVNPKARAIRPGGSAVFRVRVSNTGDLPGRNARACLRAPKRFVQVRGKACRNVGVLQPGQAKTRQFRVRLKGAARNARQRKLRLRLEARIPNASGVKVRRATATVRIAGRRR